MSVPISMKSLMQANTTRKRKYFTLLLRGRALKRCRLSSSLGISVALGLLKFSSQNNYIYFIQELE